jgi:hypothetical protein
MNNKDLALPAEQDRAVAASPSSPQAVSPVPASIPSAAWMAENFIECEAHDLFDIATEYARARRSGTFHGRPIKPDQAGVFAAEFRARSDALFIIAPFVRKHLEASAIETRSDATGTGAAEGESAGPQDDAQLSSGKSS